MAPERRLTVMRDPPLPGVVNMARDEHLLQAPLRSIAMLRTYAWNPATISLGFFQKFAAVAELPESLRTLPVVRRLTGGGAILHDLEVTYALVIDTDHPAGRSAPLALYRLVHDAWRAALADHVPGLELAPGSMPLPSPRTGPFFCFEKPGQTDLLLRGVKLLGSAQRRTPRRVLQHGSLILGRRFDAHPGAHLDTPPADVVDRWVAAFAAMLADRLELQPVAGTWDAEHLTDMAEREQRYRSDAWTRLR
jgi:lipoate-protein ligase A